MSTHPLLTALPRGHAREAAEALGPCVARAGSVRPRRGVTLVEMLITVALIAILSGITILSFGAVGGARLKRGATQIGGAIRIGYAHATATSKTVRLVFDFDQQRLLLEEADAPHLVRRDKSGGADAVTDIERAAQEAAAQVEGQRAPRAAFTTAKAVGFPPEGKELPTGIQFWQVETDHQDEPVYEGRAYLYFFPGGQTQMASIQLRISNADETDESGFMSVAVSPLTGKTRIYKGRRAMPVPRDETEASERMDTGP
jgi:general secretion pathway protein H